MQFVAVKYDRLFHLLIDRKITNAQLAKKADVSANIITRLKNDQYISMGKYRAALYGFNLN